MNTDINFEWKRPIVFSPDFARRFSELAELFKRRLITYVVTEAGFNAAEVTSYDKARVLEVSERDLHSLHRLTSALKDLEQTRWSARLKDRTSITGLAVSQLIALPNADRQRVVSAGYRNYSGNYNVLVRFSNEGFSQGTEIQLAGPFELVQQFRSELETFLSAYTQPWWFMRNSKFLGGVWLVCILLLNGCTILGALHSSSAASLHIDDRFIFGFFLPIFSILVVLAPFFFYFFHGWNWIFPMIDFVFEGGVKSSELKKNVRRALWAVPVVMILFPVIANLITPRLK